MIIGYCVLLVQNIDKITPRYHFAKGATLRYTLTEQFKEKDAENTSEATYLELVKVVTILSPGRAHLSILRTPTVFKLDGQNLPIGKPKPIVIYEDRNQRGVTRNRVLPPIAPKEYGRIQRLLDLIYPEGEIKVGTTWQASQPENLPFSACKWTFRCTKLAPTSMTIQVLFKELTGESPIHAKGTFTANTATGWLRSANIEADNVIAPGDEERAIQHLTLTLQGR